MKRNAISLFRRPALKTKQCTSADLVHLLPVNTVSTLDEYASIVFDSHITVQLQQSTRVDLVWDSYRQQHQSIYKTKVRQRNEISYGMISIHKLFEFLSQKIMSANYPEGKESCDRFTDGWLQYMFDSNCGYRYCCHPCWKIPLLTYIKYFCEYLGGLWYREEL